MEKEKKKEISKTHTCSALRFWNYQWNQSLMVSLPDHLEREFSLATDVSIL